MTKITDVALRHPVALLPESELARMAGMDTAELKLELTASLNLTASHLMRLAIIVRTLEERGEDLSDLRIGLLNYLRRIAYGQVLPEIIVRFAEYPSLVQRISHLPIPEQQRLSQGDPVAVAEGDGDHRLIDPLLLTSEQVRLVFAKDRLRAVPEQAAMLRESPRKRRPVKHGRIKTDKTRGGIVVQRTFLPVGDVLAALADLSGDEIDLSEADTTMVPVKLTTAEHMRLKVLAAKSNCTLTDLIRRAMRSHGLLSEDE